MSDYCVIINGVEWEYAPRDKGELCPWVAPVWGRCRLPQGGERLTPAHLRTIAYVMDRWAQEQAPGRAWERDRADRDALRERLAEVTAQRDALAEPARRWCEQSDDGSDTQLALRLSADAALAAIRAEREGA